MTRLAAVAIPTLGLAARRSHCPLRRSASARTREDRAGVDAEALVRSAQAGDLRAFEELLELRLGWLFRIALAITGDEVDARDAVQQASLKAWRELPRLREPGSFDAWLDRILTNECRMALRTRRRRRLREIPVSHLDPARGLDVAAAPAPGPADRAEELEILEAAFDRLHPDARAMLVLHYLQNRSIGEIATQLSLPASTVKWRLHRARNALEQALDLERR